METSEYTKISELEEKHWWYAGLREKVLHDLKNNLPSAGVFKVLDAGCGTGYTLFEINKKFHGFGVDYSVDALNFCRNRLLNRLVRADVSCLPYKNGVFDAVISLDVLYHKNVLNDKTAVCEFRRVLRPGGTLILNLPAFEFIKSNHDINIHTLRRYTRPGLKSILEKSGFNSIKTVYRNVFLFFVIAIFRLSTKFYSNTNHKRKSDLGDTNFLLNRMLLSILRFENIIFRKIEAPFGLSVYSLARK